MNARWPKRCDWERWRSFLARRCPRVSLDFAWRTAVSRRRARDWPVAWICHERSDRFRDSSCYSADVERVEIDHTLRWSSPSVRHEVYSCEKHVQSREENSTIPAENNLRPMPWNRSRDSCESGKRCAVAEVWCQRWLMRFVAWWTNGSPLHCDIVWQSRVIDETKTRPKQWPREESRQFHPVHSQLPNLPVNSHVWPDRGLRLDNEVRVIESNLDVYPKSSELCDRQTLSLVTLYRKLHRKQFPSEGTRVASKETDELSSDGQLIVVAGQR